MPTKQNSGNSQAADVYRQMYIMVTSHWVSQVVRAMEYDALLSAAGLRAYRGPSHEFGAKRDRGGRRIECAGHSEISIVIPF